MESGNLVARQLLLELFHEQVIKRVKTNVASGQLTQSKNRTGAKSFTLDRVMGQAHGLVFL